MILGRTIELNYLNTYYDRGGSQIIVAYGHSGVGKTTLIKQFIKDKPYHYYQARTASEREQRYQWSQELGNNSLEFKSFGEIFKEISTTPKEKKILIIDEFQHIVKSSSDFMKELIEYLHNQQDNMSVMIILCSSSIGWIENSMVSKIGEVAYEISGFLKIKDMGFYEMSEHFPRFRIEECIEAYAILGGTPELWNYFDDKLSIKDNICKNLLSKNCFLFRHGERIISEELREMSIYSTILVSIAKGNHKLNDLYLHTNFSRAKISVYLKNLMELELVEKVFSYDTEGKANTMKGIYRISNHFVNFYFTYLYPNLSALENLSVTDFYKKYIGTTFKTYVAEYFKVVCAQQLELWNQRKRLPFVYVKCGEWVGKLGTIDLVAQDEEGHTLIGLCNWDKPLMTYEDYEWLVFCAEKAKISVDYIYLYSIGRFDERLDLEAKVKRNIKLISVDEL